MKWIVVAAIIVFCAFRLRAAMLRSKLLGPIVRAAAPPPDSHRKASVRELLKGSVVFGLFAAAGLATYVVIVAGSRRWPWIDLNTPFTGILASASLWIGVMAMLGSVGTLVAAVSRWFASRRRNDARHSS